MIGNKIEFLHYDFSNRHDYKSERTREDRLTVGLVVDAFTEVTGKVSGKSEVFLGFGGGKTSGNTKSNRTYKVEYLDKYLNTIKYINIQDWQLVKIISYAGQSNQEKHEEKFEMD